MSNKADDDENPEVITSKLRIEEERKEPKSNMMRLGNFKSEDTDVAKLRSTDKESIVSPIRGYMNSNAMRSESHAPKQQNYFRQRTRISSHYGKKDRHFNELKEFDKVNSSSSDSSEDEMAFDE